MMRLPDEAVVVVGVAVASTVVAACERAVFTVAACVAAASTAVAWPMPGVSTAVAAIAWQEDLVLRILLRAVQGVPDTQVVR